MTRRRINTDIEQRGYIWKCQVTDNKECFIAKGESKKQPCGRWNPYFGRKWASGKSDARWQGICPHNHGGMGERKRQLNIGIVLPEQTYYTTRKDTVEAAKEMNEVENILRQKIQDNLDKNNTAIQDFFDNDDEGNYKGEWF
jgi:hypothetical protein